MIFDRIEKIDNYDIDKTAVEFIKTLSIDTECKKYILSENVYANVEEYITKESGFFEAHKDYIDIQLLLTGEEQIQVTDKDALEIKEEYDSNRDIAFFYDGDSNVTNITLSKGWFAILYPHEAHKPQLTFKETQKVKKVVVKIKNKPL